MKESILKSFRSWASKITQPIWWVFLHVSFVIFVIAIVLAFPFVALWAATVDRFNYRGY